MCNQELNRLKFSNEGCELIREFLPYNQVDLISGEIDEVQLLTKTRGIRNAEKKFSTIANLVGSDHLSSQAQRYLHETPHLVRAIVFNKTKSNNWAVGWHQDKTIAVSGRFEEPGWGPWSIKDSIIHVQPPVDVLNKMITLRIHLEDSNQENGCLRLLPKSHTLGILNEDDVQSQLNDRRPIECHAPKGSALVMRPHILHSSSKGSRPSQRRVLHLEYSSFKLPAGITWA